MLHLIFVEPRIAGNTGAAIRVSACTQTMLHLVEPLCFDMDESKVRRAGLDYHDMAHVKIHPNLDACLDEIPGRVWAFTGHASEYYQNVRYADGDALMFGSEDTGLTQEALEHPRVEKHVRIPMKDGARSMNLTNSACIGLFEALRQLDFPGLV